MRRDRVSDLDLGGSARPDDLVVIRERLKSHRLEFSESAARPVERPNVRARLALDRGRRPIRVQLQEKRPVPASPLEPGARVTTLLGEMQVVVAGWHFTQQMTVVAVDHFLRLSKILARLEVANRVVRGDIGRKGPVVGALRLGPTLMSSRCEDGLIPAECPNDEQPLAKLWDAVVSGIEDLPGKAVSSLTKPAEQ